jgi:hypothetical protein
MPTTPDEDRNCSSHPRLRGKELATTAQDIAEKTGLEHRPVADGEHGGV